jgi:hypothetical protein
MATQFIVRSEGNKQALSLKPVVYDGLQIGSLIENGVHIFELPSDADIIIELVVKRKSGLAAESNLKPPSDSRGKRKASDLTSGDSVNQAKRAELVVKRKSSSDTESNLKPPSNPRGKHKASALSPREYSDGDIAVSID